MFKQKEEKRTESLKNVTPITMTDFPNMKIKNHRVVNENKVMFTLELMDGLSIHDMQMVKKKDSDEFFIAPPQMSYKNKAGFYQNKNLAFVYLDKEMTAHIIDYLRHEYDEDYKK